MNWKLIFQLSLLGLAMGLATVFVIPSKTEPLFWVVVLGIQAYVLAVRTSKRFQHGVLLGLVNSVWVTGCHVLFFQNYIAHHPREAQMMTSMPLPSHPRVMMICMGILIGLVSGIVIGLLALLAGKVIRPRSATPAPT